MTVTHTFVNPVADDPTFTGTKPSDWNAAHTVSIVDADVAIAAAIVESKLALNFPTHAAVTLDANADTILSLSTQALGLDTQTANKVFASAVSGGAAVPAFRALVAADVPALSYQAVDADLTAIAALGFASTSFLKKTAADTWALDTATYEPADATIVKTGNASWIDLTDGGATTLHSHAGGGVSGSGTTGQIAKWTGATALGDAALIPPATNILTLTSAAAATLALNITAAKTLTLTAADNYTLTIPATGTAALLATANVFTADQSISHATNPMLSIADTDVPTRDIKIGTFTSDTAYPGIWLGQASPSDTNYSFLGGGGFSLFNAASGQFIEFRIANSTAIRVSSTKNVTIGGNAQSLCLLHVGSYTGVSDGAVPVQINADTNTSRFYGANKTNALALLVGYVNNAATRNGLGAYIIQTTADPFYVQVNNTTTALTILSTGFLGIGNTSPSARLHVLDTTATTNAVKEVMRIEARVSTASTGGAAGFGTGLTFYAETATDTTYQQQGLISTSWIDATNASRKAKLSLSAYDTAARLGIEIEASGTVVKLGFFGVATVVRPTALTTQLTAITFTAPTPDYAIQNLTNVAPYGFVTQDEGNTTLSVISNLQTRVGELETKLQALGLLT